MSCTQFRAEITATGTRVEALLYSRSVDEREPGWFGTSDQAWQDAARRLSDLGEAALQKAHEIQRMLSRSD